MCLVSRFHEAFRTPCLRGAGASRARHVSRGERQASRETKKEDETRTTTKGTTTRIAIASTPYLGRGRGRVVLYTIAAVAGGLCLSHASHLQQYISIKIGRVVFRG